MKGEQFPAGDRCTETCMIGAQKAPLSVRGQQRPEERELGRRSVPQGTPDHDFAWMEPVLRIAVETSRGPAFRRRRQRRAEQLTGQTQSECHRSRERLHTTRIEQPLEEFLVAGGDQSIQIDQSRELPKPVFGKLLHKMPGDIRTLRLTGGRSVAETDGVYPKGGRFALQVPVNFNDMPVRVVHRQMTMTKTIRLDPIRLRQPVPVRLQNTAGAVDLFRSQQHVKIVAVPIAGMRIDMTTQKPALECQRPQVGRPHRFEHAVRFQIEKGFALAQTTQQRGRPFGVRRRKPVTLRPFEQAATDKPQDLMLSGEFAQECLPGSGFEDRWKRYFGAASAEPDGSLGHLDSLLVVHSPHYHRGYMR